MFDIHCHILPRVDDGPLSIRDAVDIAYAADKAGIRAIVCTPHYTDDIYASSPDNNMTALNNLKNAIELNGIETELYLGNEIYITPDIINLLDAAKVSTLNNSRYILLEMPIYNKPLYADEVIFKLMLRGLVPIIAHPERYEWVINNPRELGDIVSKGCLVQINIASISGYYGSHAKKTVKAMLMENCVHLLGSDSHSSRILYDNYKANLKLLQKISRESKIRQILQNAEAVIYDQSVII